ncbi:hypothetical protein AXG93_4617s1000 [Marchantia polymorpha subsp. ruderalis]|uniref:Legume lectin domain-containing protein n=1 Tax=Marchantia polymorpha subsp. ruderalis TaxID=1480154 RepID=A0A176WR21_MARPO|nr:hypothetical protein AXG93_4617s1000 [Marchantia polymorpha subsp. ruderalis]
MLSEALQGNDGGSFGVFDPLGHQSARALAIEFDTFENSVVGDENNNHVGVDVQDVNSTLARSAWDVRLDLAGNYSIYSWIDYNSSAQNLEVRISSNNAKPSLPFIVYALNLFDVFNPDELVFASGTRRRRQSTGCFDRWSLTGCRVVILNPGHRWTGYSTEEIESS